MSGTMEISDEATWMPASWLYNEVVSALADGVETIDPALAQELRAGRTEVSIGYVDLSQASGQTYEALVDATTQLRDELAATDEGNRRRTLSAVGELRAILRIDPRHREPDTPSAVVVTDGVRVAAPRWAVDFVRDTLLATGLWPGDGPEGVLDLRSLDEAAFRGAVAAVDRLVRRDHGEEPGISVAPRFQESIRPLLSALSELLHADPREGHVGRPAPPPASGPAGHRR